MAFRQGILRTAFAAVSLSALLQTAIAAFVPSSRPYRIGDGGASVAASPGSVASSPTFLLIRQSRQPQPTVVARPATAFADAEAEKEEVRRNNSGSNSNNNNNSSEDGDGDSWIPTRGGFLPNLARRIGVKKDSKQLITEVTTLQDYKRVVADEKDRLVGVRFYAPWCRACRAVQSRFRKLAADYPSVKFVEAPLTEDNAYLHEGLGVPSLPFTHIYHPEVGLVDERSINKKIFADFQETLKTYVDGECQIDWNDWNNEDAE